MYKIWIDDERTTPKNQFDATAKTTNEALKTIQHKYKEGVRNFLLDIDNDTPDNVNGGEFFNVLKSLALPVKIL